MKRGQTGLGLLSVLVVVVTLGVMAAITVSALGAAGKKTGTQRAVEKFLGDATTIPRGNNSVPATSPSAQSPPRTAGQVASLTGNATAATCRGDVQAVEQAVSARQSIDGRYPTSIDDLVAGGWIANPPANRRYMVTLEVVDGRPTGRVLVNGRPGAQGCDGLS